MRYYLTSNAVLKWLESPSVYHIKNDELYELDEASFEFLKTCSSSRGCKTVNNKFIKYCLKENILTKEEIFAKRPPLIKSPEPSLRYLELQITNRCNLKCRHCYITDKRSSELSESQIKNILIEFEEMQGMRVLITGGEPLLHQNFKEINDLVPNFSVRKILFTNGLLLNRSLLKKLNVEEIQISIDGLEHAHDFIRGWGSFRSALDAVQLSLDSGFEVSIATMVHPKNLDDFDEMDSLFKKMKIKDWTVDIPCIIGRLKKNIDIQISPDQGGKYLSYSYGNGLHSSASGFACGLHLMAVMADSRVSKCTFYSDSPVGKTNDGLRACWKRLQPIKLDKLKCDCDYVELCRGGCRYRAKLFGDPFGKDFYKCSQYDIMKKK